MVTMTSIHLFEWSLTKLVNMTDAVSRIPVVHGLVQLGRDHFSKCEYFGVLLLACRHHMSKPVNKVT